MTYKEKLLDPRWQRKRLEIFQRDGFCCQLCACSDRTLHVHHKEYSSSDPWESENADLLTVCEECHFIIERLKKHQGVLVTKVARQKNTLVAFCLNEKTNAVAIFIYTISWIGNPELTIGMTDGCLMDIVEQLRSQKVEEESVF